MTLTLAPSDAANLADEREQCHVCTARNEPSEIIYRGFQGFADCSFCKGSGHVAARTGRDRISHTMLGEFLACARKHELSRVERLEPISRPAYFDMGSAFQAAIEHRDPALGAAQLRDAVPIQSQADEDTAQTQAATVAAAARYYLNRWPADEREVREMEYLVRLRSPWTGSYSRTFDLHGFADGVIDCGSHLELIENKFLGRVDAPTIKKLKLDRQITLMCYALYRATGKHVRIVHYRIVRKPSIKQRAGRQTKDGLKGAETVAQFCERVAADYANPERAEHYGVSESLFRDPAELVRVEAELWEWAEQLRSARRGGIYPRNTSQCAEYGGCTFLPICTGDPDALALYRRKPSRTPNTTAPEATT